MTRTLPACLLCVGATVACAAPPSAPEAASATPGPATDVVELSAADIRDGLTSGAFTSRALTQAYLDRIAAIDDAGPRLDAVIELNPSALQVADALDAERRSGKVRSALHGMLEQLTRARTKPEYRPTLTP